MIRRSPSFVIMWFIMRDRWYGSRVEMEGLLSGYAKLTSPQITVDGGIFEIVFGSSTSESSDGGK